MSQTPTRDSQYSTKEISPPSDLVGIWLEAGVELPPRNTKLGGTLKNLN
jgi:hypothetical protein